MVVTIDFSRPVVVIVGHWNAAILNEPGWIAKHILDVPEGSEIDMQSLIIGDQVGLLPLSSARQIWLFDSYGLSCNGQRLEFYTRNIENLASLYDAAVRISKKLPHTPIQGIGVNFMLQVREDVAAITPLLATDEALDALGAIRSQNRDDCIEIPDIYLLNVTDSGLTPTQLNLSRKTDFASCEISVNYHSNISHASFIEKWGQSRPIEHWRIHAIRTLRELYGLDNLAYTYL